ncbi:interleukin 21 receptor, tandem duplicate 1 isoform X3 [Salarias fasciatus]|uniref:interleukin 21 receptor, tandem duplicate 1 isoform X2 n=1 Tax=Salarias fasciatus TaxID=181472 RepID=UPI0011765635|nr:interleukin-21 receptor-like isoform X2 [Salarias fasciatus]XP_029959467.1 interleukin-21 receptor-like isoform X3 [Salarias fasciatus]
MASGPQFLLLLLLLGGGGTASTAAASRCDVHCSTDYVRSVNCSCSVTLPVRVHVNCSGEDQNVVGSCAVAPPRSWCLVLMEDLEEVASVGTKCWTTVSGPDGEALEKSDWQLADWVKPPAPTDVRVTDAGRSANVTWSHAGDDDCLEYNICVREASEQREPPARCFQQQQQRLLLDGGLLQLRPGAALLVRVQARFCETHFVTGPWSEWSPAAAWSPAGERGPAGERAPAAAWCFVSLPVVVLALFLLAFFQKPFLQKKLELVTFVPKPDHFFKPLYQNYRGNFKDWVKPVFSEVDYFRPALDEPLRGRRPDVLLWSCEEVLEPVAPQDREGAGPEGTGLSIHTVTLSGEDFQEDGSLRSFSEGEEPRGGAREQAPEEQEEEEDFPFRLDEAERASLDSFASGSRRSEDGYPHVDLDTIDSGFGECSSPDAVRAEQGGVFGGCSGPDAGRAEPGRVEPGRTEPGRVVFCGQQQSNYVKQWMIGSVVPEDRGESDDGLQETQTLTDPGC